MEHDLYGDFQPSRNQLIEDSMLRTIAVLFLQSFGLDIRGIFTYHDGRRYRHCDPIVFARKLWAVTIEQENQYAHIPDMVAPPIPFDYDASISLIRSGDPDQMQRGYAEISQAARQVFDVKPLSEGGLTEDECEKLLSRFQKYLGILKKNGSGSQTSPQAMESTEKSHTNSAPECGSTSTDNCSGKPEQSDLVPQQKTSQQ